MNRAAGFTLIELLASLVLMAMVLGVATNGLLNLSRQGEAAMRDLETPRRAMAILDRVARDLEGTVLVAKPEAEDPLFHPWLFFGEDRDEYAGADRVKWISRNLRSRSERRQEADVAQVAWWIDRDELGESVLLRATRPGLPPGLDRDFPPANEGALVARDVAEFSVRFRAVDGSWVEEWDSSVLAYSSDLPIAAEILIALYPDADSVEPEGPYQRTVLLPLRPLALEDVLAQLQQPAGGGDEDSDRDEDGSEGDGISLSQCLDLRPDLMDGLDEGMVDVLGQLQGSALELEELLPFALPPECR